ncbi:MAG TPA: potassium transporter Kup [Acidimicrobiia bacterium]|nr:potassium transporter Kup [Acidimicrobiia bacterium]
MVEDQTGSRRLLITSLAALGVVFGDIGTSPLYAFRETFTVGNLEVTDQNVLGILSLIFWSLVVVVSIKYLVLVMRADNHGEGGVLALTALAVRPGRARLRLPARVLLTLGVVGTAFLYGDGVITPAISVLSAVEGVSLATPALEPLVVPIAVAVIVALFSIQKRGTGQVGAVFGPVMLLWFGVMAVLGIGQLLADPSVIAAVDPSHAIRFVTSQPRAAFVSLGAVVLVVTGCEALYADMGHFGRRPIRLAWFVLAFPALVLNYFGQGALLVSRPETIDNTFYEMAPSWALFPLILLATAAAVIASQALISGAFSLTRQASHLGFLPRVRIAHTSTRELGQVYIGSVNYALMTACVVTVIAFGSSGSLAAAYGIAVTTTMLITTLLLYSVMRLRWRWNRWVAAALTTVFLAIDVAFFSANLLKITDGGWLPIAIGAAVTASMLSWFVGRRRLVARMGRGNLPIERFIGSIALHPQKRVEGTGVYLFPEPGVTPPALLANLRNNGVLHETIVLVSVQTATSPRVHRAARATVHPLGEGFFQVVLKFGYMERVDVPEALAGIGVADFGFDPTDAVYILGKETVVVPGSWRRLHLRLFALMHRNAVDAARYFKLPPEDVLEVGVQVEL